MPLSFVCFCCDLQNTQRISSSQSAQPLATPVVSVTTPSLPPQGLVYSGVPTSYNPAGESGLTLPFPLPLLWLKTSLVFSLHAVGTCSFLCGTQCKNWNVREVLSVCVCGCFLFSQSTPWAVQRSPPYRASALLGSHWAPCRHGNSINWARQLLILWCE